MRRAALLCVALTLLSGCLSSEPCDSGRDHRVLQIKLTDGGPFPSLTMLTLMQDGTVVYRSPTEGASEVCERLTPAAWSSLRQQLESPDLATALDSIRLSQYERQYYDYRGIRLARGEFETFVPCERIPEGLAALLRLLDDTLSGVFGRRYDVRISECLR